MRRKEQLHRKKERFFIKRSVLFAVMIVFAIVSFVGIEKFILPKEVIAYEAQSIHYLSGGINKQSPKQPFTSYNGQQRKVAYLTFDDGPSKYLAEILEILEANEVKATFFMVGKNLEKEAYHTAVKKAVIENHYVGVHSMSHDYHRLYIEGHAVEEMIEAQALLYNVTQVHSYLVRFPYGSFPGLNEKLRSDFVKAGLKTWDWTVDSLDWRYPYNEAKIVKNIKSQVNRNREIILFHETKQTVHILPQVISYLEEQGYEIVPYNEFSHFALNQYNDERM